jgi:hypothetical protein
MAEQATNQQQIAQAQLSQARFIAIQQDQEQQQAAAIAAKKTAANQKKAKHKKQDQNARLIWLLQMVASVLQWFGILLGAIPVINSLLSSVRGINSKFKGAGKMIPFMEEIAPGYAPGRRPEDYVVILGIVATVAVALPIIGFIFILLMIVAYIFQNPIEAATMIPNVVIGVIQGTVSSN